MDKVDIVDAAGKVIANDLPFVRAPCLGEWVQAPSKQWAQVIVVAHQPGPNPQVLIQLGSWQAKPV